MRSVNEIGLTSVNLKDVKTNNYDILMRLKTLLRYLGPAFIVSVAYIDPGNFATNISGGSTFNYSLIWVILWSNLMAIFLQYLSAKLGIATEKNLSEMCGEVFSKKTNILFWCVAELAAIATTMAEFLGGALGIYLLFKIPLSIAGTITGIITFAITYLQKCGQRIVEVVITFLIGVICIAYAIEIFLAKPDWIQVGIHTFVPTLTNGEALLIAAGMLGATVMPHVIYLHSQLVQKRNHDLNIDQKKRHLKMEKIDILIAMNIAFIVNVAMVIVSAAVFFKEGLIVNTIEEAHRSLEPLLGTLSSVAFAIALLASGFSSSAVGAMAGETVMDGFINIKFPPNIKRLVTIIPAMLVICSGINPMKALVISQVSLSFALPFAIIPMIIITGRREHMGDFVNKFITNIIGWFISSLIITLNVVLIYMTITGRV
ncbi:manganese transport protein [Thermoanaerobacterium sp. RBIITD]|nr:Nramp family divalent metal transporter [Thermoanaerobacterium sp. RBIITD]SNX54020.1 manganese transport protein [Thermoanaerobacterium sp. RBIITD]